MIGDVSISNHLNNNEQLKYELIILSLSPLFLLTLIKNFKCSFERNDFYSIVEQNAWLLLVVLFSILWIIASVCIYLKYKSYRMYDNEEGYTITDVEKEKDAGLNYLLTFILPLVFDDLDCWQNVVSFFIIVILILILLSKTNLYYENPILTILGYQIIKFKFKNPPDVKLEGEMIGICPEEIDKDKVIAFKLVSDNVLCIKQRRQ